MLVMHKANLDIDAFNLKSWTETVIARHEISISSLTVRQHSLEAFDRAFVQQQQVVNLNTPKPVP